LNQHSFSLTLSIVVAAAAAVSITKWNEKGRRRQKVQDFSRYANKNKNRKALLLDKAFEC